MYAAVLEEYGEPVVIEEREVPTVAPDGVVVSVEACGICRSDWHGGATGTGSAAARI